LETFRIRGAVDTLAGRGQTALLSMKIFLKDFLLKTPHYPYGSVESCETDGALSSLWNALTTGCFGYIALSGGLNLLIAN
jgi:hypothetical protein